VVYQNVTQKSGYCFISWSRDLLQKLRSPPVKKKKRLLYNPQAHYRVQDIPPLVPILSQMNLVHILSPYFSEIHCNIILPSTLRFSSWSLPFRFTDKIFVGIYYLSHSCYMSHHPWFLTQVIFCEDYTLWSSSLCSFLQSSVIFFLLRPNILLSTMFSNTLSIRSWINVTPTQNKMSSVYCIISFYREETGRQNTAKWMVASIPW